MPLVLLPVTALAQGEADWMKANSVSSILAEAANGKKKEGFFGAVSLGYLATTGNTDSASLNAKTLLGYLSPTWRHALMLRALKGSTGGVATAEEYEALEQSDYTFGDNNYVFGALDYSVNHFSGFDQRVSEVVGYGRRVIDTSAHKLDLQIGVGARQTELSSGASQNENIVQVAGGYIWKFNEHANFTQQVKVEKGSDNTYSESVTAVTANLIGNLALSVSYTVKHNSDVPPDRVKTDTSTAVSLIYAF